MAVKQAATAEAEAGRIVLKPKLDFAGSEDLAQELRSLRGRDLSIDGSAVDLLGAHAVQTLLVAARSWASDGHAFAVTGLPGTAVEQLAMMGLDQTLLDGEGAD